MHALLVAEAARKNCKIVFLPECFSFIGAKPGEAQAAAEPLDGPTMQRYRQLAKEHKVWLSLGGFQEKSARSISGVSLGMIMRESRSDRGRVA